MSDSLLPFCVYRTCCLDLMGKHNEANVYGFETISNNFTVNAGFGSSQKPSDYPAI